MQILATPKTDQSDWTRFPLIGPQQSKPPDGLSVLGSGHYYIKQRQRLTTKKKKQPNALQRTCSASLVRSASLSSSVMGSIFQCSSCREMKDKLNKTLRRMGREGQAPKSRSTYQVSATGSNWDYYFPTPSFARLTHEYISDLELYTGLGVRVFVLEKNGMTRTSRRSTLSGYNVLSLD